MDELSRQEAAAQAWELRRAFARGRSTPPTPEESHAERFLIYWHYIRRAPTKDVLPTQAGMITFR